MSTLAGFHPYRGTFKVMPMSIKASTVVPYGAAMDADNAGTAGELGLGASDDFIVAVYCDTPIAAADSDYTSIKSNKSVWLVEHSPIQLWKARVSSGTAVHATEALDYADLASATTLTLTDTNKDFRILKVLDGTADNGVVVGYFASFTTEPSA